MYAAAYNTFLDSPLEQEGGTAVLHGQILSSKSGILWMYGAFKTTVSLLSPS
jgi:hypothetical protein